MEIETSNRFLCPNIHFFLPLNVADCTLGYIHLVKNSCFVFDVSHVLELLIAFEGLLQQSTKILLPCFQVAELCQKNSDQGRGQFLTSPLGAKFDHQG
jgi:hypothetical protein